MPPRIQPSKFGQQKAPDSFQYTPNATLSVERGAVVTYDTGNDELDEHAGGATVTGILGVTGHGCSSGESDDPSGLVLVNKAKDQEFVGPMLESAAIKTDLSDVSIGDQYGIIKHTDDIWYVDFDDTGDVVVQITKIDDDLDLVWFRFLESAIQEV